MVWHLWHVDCNKNHWLWDCHGRGDHQVSPNHQSHLQQVSPRDFLCQRHSLSISWFIFQLSSNILASGYCIYKGNPFSLYGENVFIGAQMLIIILLFVTFGTGNKLVYLGSFFVMILAAYFITDPQNIPNFVVENSIIVQSLLSIFWPKA